MRTRHSVLCAVAVLFFSTIGLSPVMAAPVLQVDILGGTYDPVTETIVTSNNSFTVRAWLTPKSPQDAILINDYFKLSMAIVPKTGSAFNPVGSSFKIGSDTINVTEDMVYGVPPLETLALQSGDPNDLGDHGIFDTFFAERSFQFNPLNEYATVNVQDNPGVALSAGSGSYVVEFAVEVSGLSGSVGNQPIGLHFDLYNTKLGKDGSGDIDRDDFAPFSHDAEYVPPGRENAEEVPEPASVATWALLGAIGLAFTRKVRLSR